VITADLDRELAASVAALVAAGTLPSAASQVTTAGTWRPAPDGNPASYATTVIFEIGKLSANAPVSLAAALATLRVFTAEPVCAHLHTVGTRLLHGCHALAAKHPGVVTGVAGVAEMSFLHYVDERTSTRVARACAARGILFKRTAYNFVSYAHDERVIDRTLGLLDEVLAEVAREP